ncbi:hypothetical protein ACHAXA_003122 [Cyclostephanos tholiformis]|uniref:Uncharacterized protein n=1 Tax=Cyclostephanos tholiformis TaxID=382380 RepID=A0ABD3ST12_9STRA
MGPKQVVNEVITSSTICPEEKASIDVNECDTYPPWCRPIHQIRSSIRRISRSVPEQAPLYAALFFSLVAVTLSVRTHLSTRFVSLEEPFRVSPFFKDVGYIGLSTWELCSIKQDALDAILAGEIIKNEMVPSDSPPTIGRTATDVPSNVTFQHSLDYFNEPVQDDVLAPGVFPYNDDDRYSSELLKDDYWHCHNIHMSSANVGDDKLWDISRVFFMLGTIMGMTSTVLLIALIVRRGQDAKSRWLRGKLRRYKRNAKTQSVVLQQLEEGEKILFENNWRMLDTDYRGYRSISICFLVSYLMQSLTLLFFDSDICRKQVCLMATSAHGLLVASLLWVMSSLLILSMMKKIMRNREEVRRFKNMGRKKNVSMQNIQSIDTDTENIIFGITHARENIANDLHDTEMGNCTDAGNSLLSVTYDTESFESEITDCSSDSSGCYDEVTLQQN